MFLTLDFKARRNIR